MKALPDILVFDTCVLLPNVLRRAFLQLASLGCFSPAWSRVIGDEWCRNATRLWDIPEEDVLRQWLLLQQAWPHADMGDVQAYKEGLVRSDRKDWHVIAAARKALALGGEDVRVGIVTRNIRDFHRGELYQLNLELLDPDQMFVRCLAQFPQACIATMGAVPVFSAEFGREPEPLNKILKRERLFRLNKLLTASEESLLTPRDASSAAATIAAMKSQ